MDSSVLARLSEYMQKSRETTNITALEQEYVSLFDGSKSLSNEEKELIGSAQILAHELFLYKQKERDANKDAVEALSEEEREELAKVKGLIDNNLFTYHFQPIVRADNGEIYSYEALMRSGDIKGITPFHILKYAEFMDRLGEIEQYTFTNMLKFIKANKQLFEGRMVFINSMPSVRVSPEKDIEIENMLGELSDTVVVEMTEQSEFNENDLDRIKEKFTRLGIKIAIDDYGTGYSNISNLLRYKPNFVKIDRTLLSGIQDNPNKKHFVREIIDFCHSNGIMALAEGVETEQELRTVILLGVDLIQGYYTARPSAEVIASLPYEIKSEIRLCSEERVQGKRSKVYIAAQGERVSLDKLCKGEYSSIIIGSDYNDGSVVIAGAPYLDTQIHIEVAEGYKGSFILEHAHLSNLVTKPCIDISENCDCTLVIKGDNRLENSGIRIHESSRLTFEGIGILEIFLGNSDYYGIGNDLESRHGEIVFRHNAKIVIKSSSHSGVCIGSGLGGSIIIESGEYSLEAHGSTGVCLGALNGDVKLDVVNCDLEARAAGAASVIIGSLNGNADVKILKASLRLYGYSAALSVLGTVHGDRAAVDVENASVRLHSNGNNVTCMGSLYGDSKVSAKSCTIIAQSSGERALVIGGENGKTDISVVYATFTMECSSIFDFITFAKDEDINITGGNLSVKLNDEEFTEIINKK